MEYLCHVISFYIWFLEALPDMCSAVQCMLRPFFTLPYCIAGCFVGRRSRRPPERMFYISWCNSDGLIWTLNLEHTYNFFSHATTWTTSALCHGWEVTTSISRFGKSILKNCHANVRMATALTSLFRWLSSEINEVLASIYCSCVCF